MARRETGRTCRHGRLGGGGSFFGGSLSVDPRGCSQSAEQGLPTSVVNSPSPGRCRGGIGRRPIITGRKERETYDVASSIHLRGRKLHRNCHGPGLIHLAALMSFFIPLRLPRGRPICLNNSSDSRPLADNWQGVSDRWRRAYPCVSMRVNTHHLDRRELK